MVFKREPFIWDRPFEVFNGLFLSIAGWIVLITTIITGETTYAPFYISNTSTFIVLTYAVLAIIGGSLVPIGFGIERRPESSVLGRGLQAVGHTIMIGVVATYLVIGDFRSPSWFDFRPGNTLAASVATAWIISSSVRAWRLWRLNAMVIRALKEANNGGNI